MLDFDLLVRAEQHKDLMCDLAGERLARAARASRKKPIPFYASMLAWLLERLLAWCLPARLPSMSTRARIARRSSRARSSTCATGISVARPSHPS